MPTWPASLPQYPIRDSYQEERPFPVVQAPVDGPPLSRRRYTAAPVPVKVEFNFSPTQFAAWETFYNTYIARGALSFTAPLRDSTSLTASYRIVGPPRERRLGAGWWRVSMDWIRLP
jgi:hypothetical protein